MPFQNIDVLLCHYFLIAVSQIQISVQLRKRDECSRVVLLCNEVRATQHIGDVYNTVAHSAEQNISHLMNGAV